MLQVKTWESKEMSISVKSYETAGGIHIKELETVKPHCDHEARWEYLT